MQSVHFLHPHLCHPTPDTVVDNLDGGYSLLTVSPASAPLPLQSTATRVTLNALPDHRLPGFPLDLESNIASFSWPARPCVTLPCPLPLWPHTSYQAHFRPRAFGLAIPAARIFSPLLTQLAPSHSLPRHAFSDHLSGAGPPELKSDSCYSIV